MPRFPRGEPEIAALAMLVTQGLNERAAGVSQRPVASSRPPVDQPSRPA